MKDKIESTLDLFGNSKVIMHRHRQQGKTSDFTISLVRAKLMKEAEGKGAPCPCCHQFVKIYKRKITSTMARQLITAYHKFAVPAPARWFHVRDVMGQSDSGIGDFSKLEIWGLIEAQPHRQGEDGKRASGMWRITQKGIDFINNRCAVQQYALIYNGSVQGFSENEMRIHHALGQKYDYREIMGWTSPPASVV